ncbi:protein ASPARTIC PROTEASE IN GUARD CELL 2-like [Quercus robur]|uniref:protein ASPARTIC PROTEASE IN GUARD CELL 2-like n=1 Tax=Quercus robur TaxID=38942 RepID=UPI00216324D3|nr:protein ASPARTIC PROTEASE IN GUARD CELL 2-like [Quercus robur]
MKRNAKRVANLIHQLDEDGVYYPEVERFKEDVSSYLRSGEYFIPVGLGTPPMPQYLVIDTGSDIGWASLLSNKRASSFYYIKLVGLGAESIQLPIHEDVFQIPKSGHRGVIMDTGTMSSFRKVAYEALRDAFVAKTTNVPRLPGVEMFDTCYNLSGFVYRIPIILFYFSSGTVVNIPPNNFLIVADGGISCLAFASSFSDLSIIGNVQQKQIQITIDTASVSAGFGPNNC